MLSEVADLCFLKLPLYAFLSCRIAPDGQASLTSLLTSDDTREAHSFLESDQILNLIPMGRRAERRAEQALHSRSKVDETLQS